MTCELCDGFPATLEALVGWRHVHDEEAPCWFLVRLIYNRHLGLQLPHSNVLMPRRQRELIDAHRAVWRPLEAPARYDVVLVRGRRDHIGVAVSAEAFVHLPAVVVRGQVQVPAGTVLSRLADLRDPVLFYRHPLR